MPNDVAAETDAPFETFDEAINHVRKNFEHVLIAGVKVLEKGQFSTNVVAEKMNSALAIMAIIAIADEAISGSCGCAVCQDMVTKAHLIKAVAHGQAVPADDPTDETSNLPARERMH